MTLSGLLLSVAMFQLDWLVWDSQVPFLSTSWGVDSDGVRSLFISISAAIITAMTTILSITLLIFTVLSGQFGAHVLRVFKIRTFSKFVIGWFSGTYIYIVYCIYRMTTSDQNGYAPQIALTVGIVLTLSTIFLLILYIHFLVRQIQAGTVISAVSKELNAMIKSYEPYEKEKERKISQDGFKGPFDSLSLNQSGYLQSVDKNKLQSLAKDNNIGIEILYRIGRFIFSGVECIRIYSVGDVSEEVQEDIRSCLIVGEKRIPVEDLECNLELLIEMILRALSPGINDLVLANHCIDFLCESVALLIKKETPTSFHTSDSGALLLVTKEFTVEGYLSAALNPIRQYAAPHCTTAIRLLDNLIAIAKIAPNEKRFSFIEHHFETTWNSAKQQQTNEMDLQSLNERKDLFAHCKTRS